MHFNIPNSADRMQTARTHRNGDSCAWHDSLLQAPCEVVGKAGHVTGQREKPF